MRSFRTGALLAAGAAVAAAMVTVNPAAAAPATPEAPASPRVTGCHIRAINDGVRIRQAPDPNAIVDGLLYRGQTLPSDCKPFKGAATARASTAAGVRNGSASPSTAGAITCQLPVIASPFT